MNDSLCAKAAIRDGDCVTESYFLAILSVLVESSWPLCMMLLLTQANKFLPSMRFVPMIIIQNSS